MRAGSVLQEYSRSTEGQGETKARRMFKPQAQVRMPVKVVVAVVKRARLRLCGSCGDGGPWRDPRAPQRGRSAPEHPNSGNDTLDVDSGDDDDDDDDVPPKNSRHILCRFRLQ